MAFTQTFLLYILEVQSTPVTVGRFQVTPSIDIPVAAVSVPAALQPEVSSSNTSESSTEEQGESETSLGTSVTMSPPHPQRRSSVVVQALDRQPVWAGSQEPQQEQLTQDRGAGDEDEDAEVEFVGERQRTKKRSRRRAYSLSLSVDSGLSLTAAEMEGRQWDGGVGSPQHANALHHLLMMTYSRSAPYPSSDDSDSEDGEMVEELQELRER